MSSHYLGQLNQDMAIRISGTESICSGTEECFGNGDFSFCT